LALFLSAVKRFPIYLCIKLAVEDVSGAAVVEEVELKLELCAGPRPSLIIARESGIILVCQPLSS
jgi:hypothetical protein